MEVDLEVGLRLRALAQAERKGSTKAQKETRRARVLAERTEEVRVATEDLQARALEHLSKAREADEDDSDDGDEDERVESNPPETPAVHEYLGRPILCQAAETLTPFVRFRLLRAGVERAAGESASAGPAAGV